jgi:tetratricopeptide (TPR) repeat protein
MAGRHEAAAASFAKVAESVAVGRKTNPSDDEIAKVGLNLSDFYGQLGLWEEAATLHHECLSSPGEPSATWPWALEAQYRLLQGDREGFDKIFAAMARSTRPTFDPMTEIANRPPAVAPKTKSPASDTARDVLVQTFLLVPDPPSTVVSNKLDKWAIEQASAVRGNTSVRNHQLAWAYFRAGKYEEALTACRADSGLTAAHRLAEAMTLFKLGRADDARRLLDQVENWYSKAVQISLTATPLAPHRELSIRFPLERQEAYMLITGKPAPVNPWWQLYRGRLLLALGQSQKGETELQAAVATRPDDPGILLARSHIYEERGRVEQAKADFTKALKGKSDDARPWIEHGHLLVERGRHKEADEAFAKAAAAAPQELYRFLEAGWWAVGPFVGPLDSQTQVEGRPDPASPVGDARWLRIRPDSYGRVDLLGEVGAPKDTSIYAVTYVYSPDERTTLLHVGGVNRLRLWVNGNLVHETAGLTVWTWGTDWVPVTLRSGRNTLLVQVIRGEGAHDFFLRLGDEPSSRGITLAQLGLWKEAADAWKPLFAEELPTDHFLWPAYGQFLLLSGDTEGYRSLRARVLRHVGTVTDPWMAHSVSWLLLISPDPLPGADNLFGLCNNLFEGNPPPPWLSAKMAHLAYRMGRNAEAEKFLEKVPGTDVTWEGALAAMIHHRAGREKQARKCLDQFEAWYQNLPGETIAGTEYRSPFGAGYWVWAQYLLRRQEAHASVRGAAPKDDPVRDAIERHGRKVWSQRDPATEAYDHALRLQPGVARLWFARAARRLALGRREEATADFRKAVELAVDDPPIQKEYLQLYAQLGNPEQAAAAFTKHLDRLPKDERWMSARSAAVIDLVPFKAAFDKLIEIRPADTHLIVCRARDHFRRGRFTEAAADYSRVIHERPVSEDWLEACEICLLTGDEAGHRELCRALIEKAGDKPAAFDCFVLARCCGLSRSSGIEPARLVGWANQALESGRPPWYLHALGLAHYRAGDYEAAISALEQSIGTGWADQGKGQNWLVLAMVHAKAGHQEEARQCLERGRECTKKAAPPGPGQPTADYSGDWGALQILLAEAEKVVEGKRAKDSN